MCFACTESVTITGNERLFNKLKIAKNNLRKTQEGSRLNNFMLLSSEKIGESNISKWTQISLKMGYSKKWRILMINNDNNKKYLKLAIFLTIINNLLTNTCCLLI